MRRVRSNFKDPCWYGCFKGWTITFDFLSESNHDKRVLRFTRVFNAVCTAVAPLGEFKYRVP